MVKCEDGKGPVNGVCHFCPDNCDKCSEGVCLDGYCAAGFMKNDHGVCVEDCDQKDFCTSCEIETND